MTYEQLKNFISIVEVGSFKAAAEKEHKSQPALSMSIKKLEAELGLRLFSREAYRPSLTAQGELFFKQAQEALKGYYELETLAQELSRGVEPQLNLAIDAIVPLQNLGPSLQRFFADKKTELNLSMEVLEGSYALLEEEKADLAIAPLIHSSEQFQYVSLFSVKMIPVISTDLFQDPLQQKLLKIPQIVVRSSQRTSEKDFGVSKGKKWYVSEHSLKAHLIQNSLGWGRLPEHLIKEDLATGRLTQLKGKGFTLSEVEVGLVKKKEKALGQVGNELWEILKNSKNNQLF